MSQAQINREANRKLVKIYKEKGITTCELRLYGCKNDWGLTFAHRYKRRFYKNCPEKLASFNHTLLACICCHDKIEYDSELSAELFDKLRRIND